MRYLLLFLHLEGATKPLVRLHCWKHTEIPSVNGNASSKRGEIPLCFPDCSVHLFIHIAQQPYCSLRGESCENLHLRQLCCVGKSRGNTSPNSGLRSKELPPVRRMYHTQLGVVNYMFSKKQTLVCHRGVMITQLSAVNRSFASRCNSNSSVFSDFFSCVQMLSDFPMCSMDAYGSWHWRVLIARFYFRLLKSDFCFVTKRDDRCSIIENKSFLCGDLWKLE